MEAIEIYRQLFFDSLLSGLIFPLRDDLAFKALYHFGEQNPSHLLVSALLAATIAAIINWLLGTISIRLILEGMGGKKGELLLRYEDAVCFMSRYGFLVVTLFFWVSYVGPAITFLAGFFKMRLWVLTLSAISSKLLYYMLFIASS